MLWQKQELREYLILILTRSIGEVFRVGDDVKITILDTRNMQARIGIDAPRDTPVHREEIFQRIKREEQSSISGCLHRI